MTRGPIEVQIQAKVRVSVLKADFEATHCFVSMKCAKAFFKATKTAEQLSQAIADGSVRIGMPPKKPGHRSIFDLNLSKGQWMVKYIPETVSNP